jgi:SAM-dependent methyltransferase
MSDINAFDEEFWRVTKGLPIRTGSILRVPGPYYSNWGIEVTDENREQIIEKYDFYRQKDYKEKEGNKGIEALERTPLSIGIRTSMRRTIVHIAKEIMKMLDDGKREFRICDLAASNGGTVSGLATALWSDRQTQNMLRRTSFYLVDYSGSKLEDARAELEAFRPGLIDTHMGKDELFLEKTIEKTREKFDIVLSLCHLHKKPFLEGVLGQVHKVLEKNGLFLSGDWHSSLCNHPAYTYELLQRMAIDRKRLEMFRELLHDFMDPISEPDTMHEELRGRAEHQEYWAGRHQQILAERALKEGRHYFLGAFDTTRARVDSLEKASLTVDPDKIKKAFPKAGLPQTPMRMMHKTDRASVIMAMKVKRVK